MQNGRPQHGTDTHHLAGGGRHGGAPRQRGPRQTADLHGGEKLAILREIDACPDGHQGEVLRKHGIYSSHLTKRRRQRAAGTLVPTKRGPKVDEHAKRLARPARELARLTAKLQKAELIIDAQKSRCTCLGCRSLT